MHRKYAAPHQDTAQNAEKGTTRPHSRFRDAIRQSTPSYANLGSTHVVLRYLTNAKQPALIFKQQLLTRIVSTLRVRREVAFGVARRAKRAARESSPSPSRAGPVGRLTFQSLDELSY
jgi:hypothetical protein